MGRKEPPPITLGELRRERIRVMARCILCGHMTMLDAGDVPLPDDADMGRMSQALHCTGCGKGGGKSAHPDPQPWVRYLRRTGQRERLPYYAPMIRDEPDS